MITFRNNEIIFCNRWEHCYLRLILPNTNQHLRNIYIIFSKASLNSVSDRINSSPRWLSQTQCVDFSLKQRLLVFLVHTAQMMQNANGLCNISIITRPRVTAAAAALIVFWLSVSQVLFPVERSLSGYQHIYMHRHKSVAVCALYEISRFSPCSPSVPKHQHWRLRDCECECCLSLCVRKCRFHQLQNLKKNPNTGNLKVGVALFKIVYLEFIKIIILTCGFIKSL